jgi:outer membrane protein OmpA-like peptidoglycan-associated protein
VNFIEKRSKLCGVPSLSPKVLVLLFPLVLSGLGAEEFIYKHKAGDRYRILSTVNEDVYVNRRLSHRAEILNRIAVEVTEVNGGTGRHEAVFQTAEKALGAGRSFQWAREYESRFDRDRLGYLSIDRKYFMPVVRNVPVFPGRDLKSGDVWSAEGHEAHDFRDSFGIGEPYRIPFTAAYAYLGERERKGKPYAAFSVTYRISAKPSPAAGKILPVRILGASDQTIFWDFDLGQTAAYEEYFRMVFELSNGATVEYRGRAEAEIVESPVIDKDKIAGEISEEIKRLDITDTFVRVDDSGITISLENIQFEADSAVLRVGEKQKLNKLAEILRRYPDRDILVGGHTALAGTAAMRAELSRKRAAAVADYLLSENVRTQDRVVVRGYGAEKPLGDNGTEEGRRKNRRVEITILEN